MAAIFLEENSIVLAAANKMVSLGKEAAERIVAGRESKSQDKTIDQILKLLTVYRNKASLSTDDLESILYDLKGLSEADSFPTISPIVGQELVYLVNEESGGGTGTLQIQNNSSDLPIRSTLNFYTILQAVDAGGKTNVGIIPGTDGYVLTMDSGVAQWLPVSGGHVIENYGTPLTQRDNINVSNGLTAVDNTPDTDFKLGGELVEQTQIETTGFDFSIGNIATGDGIIQLIDNGTDADIQLEQSDFSFRLYGPTNGSTATFTDSRGTTLGIQYAADYSAGFNARSLIDKGYADATYAPISGGTYWSLASGGTLTGNNTITGTGYTLKGIWDGLANAQTNGYGLWLANTTAAASGAANQQWSPSLVLEGQGWSGGGATQSIKFVVTTIPVSGQTGELLISSSVNGGANVSRLGIGASSSISFYQSGYGTWSVSTGAVVSGDSGDAEFVHAANYGFIFTPNNYGSSSFTINRLGNILAGPRGSAPAAKLEVIQGALSASWLPSLKVTPGAHTSMTASTEFVSNDFVGASQQWLAGTVATQRFNYFRGFTVTGASATATFTNVYTLYVDAPVAGTNATITNGYALGVFGNTPINLNGTAQFAAGASGWGSIFNVLNGTTGFLIRNFTGDVTATSVLGLGTSSVNNFFQPTSGTLGRSIISTSVGLALTSGTWTGNYLVFDYFGTITANTITPTNTVAIYSVRPTYNITTGTMTVIGYNYDPTITSLTGATHYAFRSTSGGVLLAGGLTTADAGATITASTKLDVRGIGTTSSTYPIRIANSSNSALFLVRDDDKTFVSSYLYVGTPTTAGGDRYIYPESSAANVGLYIWNKGNGLLTLSTDNSSTGNVVIYGHNIAIGGDTRSTAPGDIDIVGNDSSLSGAPGSHIYIRSGHGSVGDANSGNVFVYIGDKSGAGVRGNIGLFSSDTDFDGGELVIRISSRVTAPSGALLADNAYMYVEDITAGNAAPHFMTENGSIIKLYKYAAITTALTTITHTAPGTPDYAIQDLTAGGFGFVTKDEGNTVLSVVANLQARVNELEDLLQAMGMAT